MAFRAIAEKRPDLRWLVIAAEPITDVDTTASDMLQELDVWLNERGVSLIFAEMKDPVRERSSGTSSPARSTRPTSSGRSTTPSPSTCGKRVRLGESRDGLVTTTWLSQMLKPPRRTTAATDGTTRLKS